MTFESSRGRRKQTEEGAPGHNAIVEEGVNHGTQIRLLSVPLAPWFMLTICRLCSSRARRHTREARRRGFQFQLNRRVNRISVDFPEWGAGARFCLLIGLLPAVTGVWFYMHWVSLYLVGACVNFRWASFVCFGYMGNLATPTLGGRIHRPTRHLFFRLVQVVGLEFITFIKNPDSVRSKNKVPLKIHSYQNHRNCQINDGIINFAPIRKRPLSTSFTAPGEG